MESEQLYKPFCPRGFFVKIEAIPLYNYALSMILMSNNNMADQLIEAIDKKQSPVCVGLDPRLQNIPKFIVKKQAEEHGNTPKAVAEAFKEFSIGIIDEVADLVPAVKPQNAFWEMYGSDGVKALIETIAYAKSKDLVVIEDAKRQDIGSTAEAYAQGHLGAIQLPEGEDTMFDADWLTVGPYLGSDSVFAFKNVCKEEGKGIFVLVRTSNPSAKEFQDLNVEGKEHFFHVAAKVNEWGRDMIGERGFSPIGAVVGATYPHEAEALRKAMPNTFFLVPGYGAQGGSAKDVVPNFDAAGYGAIVNNARGIIFAYEKSKRPEQEFALAARDAVVEMKDAILKALKEAGKMPKGWR